MAGGYDPRIESCADTLRHLERVADQQKLSHSTTSLSSQVLFLTNLSEVQKMALLKSSNTKALLYTPAYEHLGIGPLEAMACGLPVLAVNNGGPVETIIDGITGYLRPATKTEWSSAIIKLLNLSKGEQEEMSQAGKRRVQEYFDVGVMASGFEKAAKDVLHEAETGKLPDVWIESAALKIVLAGVLTFLGGVSIAFMVYFRRDVLFA